jgi:DNA-binding response OmpR family regulator
MDLRAKRDERSPESKPSGLASGVGGRPSVDTTVAKTGALPRARILVVEDQDDVRRMMATALEIEGYIVDEACNADDGLRHLECITYDLVLSDYAMPGGTGAWMLQEARRRSLICDVAAVIVTAHAEIRELPGVSVVHKPLDLDAFLDQVRRLIFPPQHRERDPRAVHQKLELVLYVSSRSRASAEALRNLQSFLAHVDPAHVKCAVVDLEERPQDGDADRITFTPTLVKQHPGPRTWIIGTLGDPCIFENLLRAAGINGGR